MPHFKLKHLELPKLPISVSHTSGDFTFLECFNALKNPKFSLLQVDFTPKNAQQKRQFFLEIKKDKDSTIVRFDKHSRIAPIEIIKNALRILKQSQNSVINDNLNATNLPLESKLPFIKNIRDFLDFSALKGDFKEIWLEIGFGSGRHLLHNAKNNKDILHIGLEIHSPSLEQVARQIGLLNLKNALILGYDARIFLELLPSNTLHKIFVHFPVPWDKKPHRRIFSNAFLQQAARVLGKNGHLQLRTDSLEYFNFAKDLALNFSQDFKAEFHTNTQGEVISKYEERWKRASKDIFNAEFYALRDSKEQKLDFNFNFFDSTLPLEKNFKRLKIVESDYFLHFEELFLGDKNKILRIAFGDFNYPESRYILESEGKLAYFRENPLPTPINHKAHLKLIQSLKDTNESNN